MKLLKEVEGILQKLEIELKIRGFSKATISAYKRHNFEFLTFTNKQPNKTTIDDVKAYQVYLYDKGIKPTSTSLKLSSIKFLFNKILKIKLITDEVGYPKLPKKIPDALTRNEVQRLFSAVSNKKHLLLLKFMYGSGLRVSECVNFKIKDLIFDNLTAKVRGGKGNKERMIILSEEFISLLKEYLNYRKEKQSEYLFPSKRNPNKPITVRAAQNVIEKAAKNAGFNKRVYCHILRSSFATHLLEDNTDIRYIQELLGHINLDTTERYTKVNPEILRKVKSPLDKLNNKSNKF